MIKLRCDNKKGQLVGIRGKVTGLEQVREKESTIHQNAELKKAGRAGSKYRDQVLNHGGQQKNGKTKHG